MLRLHPLESSFLLFLLVAGGCSHPREPYRVAAPDPATQRATPSGALIGGDGRYGSSAWLGIPYAKPPVGDLRWRAPQPLAPWSGVREALAFGAPCPQYASPFGGVEEPPGTPVGSEDCLTLNVWTPRFPPGEVPTGAKRLPVMVWIHGGGNSYGRASFYEGGNLATSEGLVLVTVQYRLGPFGWLRHAALRAGAANDQERSGNFGILDLVRSLEWVRDNIAAFGGDPGNVTIFGESAGATDVYALLVAPQAKGLFQRAIAESGGTYRTSPEEAENLVDAAQPGQPQSSGELVLRLFQRDGAADRSAAKTRLAAMSDVEVAAYLHGKSTAEILGAYTPEPSGMIRMPLLFADGSVLPQGPLEERFASEDGWNRVPVIVGTNRDEYRLFMFPNPNRIRKVLWILPRFVNEKTYLATADARSRMWKATGADGPAAALRRSEPNVFVYRFDWDEEPTLLGADLSKMLGASHGFEIPFVFGHFDFGRGGRFIFDEKNRAGREALAKSMMSYWAAFAKNGDPGRGLDGSFPAWTAWDDSSATAPKYIVLDTPEGGGIRMASEIETPEGVVASVDSDPRLATPGDRCEVLGVLASWSRGFSKEQYASHQECSAYPLDSVASR
ncbi:MAG TPA: carboxylesterase family protein [Myxococcota bacterium]|nr:carboxylesterase family protein [Myxococcota bacterium]